MTTDAGTRPALGLLDVETYANGDPTTYGLPLDVYQWYRDNEPCYLQEFDDPMLIERVWVLSRNEDIWTIDRDTETFATDRGYVNIWKVTPIDPTMGGSPAMLSLSGEDHKRNRGVISRGFTPKVVKRLEQKFRDYAVTIVNKAIEKGTFNFVDEIAHAMPMEALGDVLGVPPEDRAKFFHWVDQFAAPFDTRITPSFDHVMAAIGDLMVYATELAEKRKVEPGEDVMSQIVKASADETLTEDEMMGNVALLASGAAESTRTALSHGVHELMRNPEQMAWLRERATAVPDTVAQEFVRIASPFTHLVRTTTRDVEWHGKTIKEGEQVAMLFASGNFDERAIENPRAFDLSRDPNMHVSFGRGPHTCLGKHVAALEMKILLEELLQRTKSIEPAGEIDYVRDAYSRGVYSLPVTVTPA